MLYSKYQPPAAKEGCAESLGCFFFFFSFPPHSEVSVSCWDPDAVRPCVENWLGEGHSCYWKGQEVLPANCSKTGVYQFGQCYSDSWSHGRRADFLQAI